jgi:hypothetical protein
MKRIGSILLLAFGVSGCAGPRYQVSVTSVPSSAGLSDWVAIRVDRQNRSIVVFIQSGHQQDFTETRVASDIRRDGHAEAMNYHMPNKTLHTNRRPALGFGLSSRLFGAVRSHDVFVRAAVGELVRHL